MVPAMNPAMWSHPATAASVAQLREWGIAFLPPGEGRTACGESGEGRLAEPGRIVAAVEAALAPAERRLKILVTSGGTAEPIDGVRVLGNTSTGRTGAGIAAHLARCGHGVTLLRAAGSAAAGPPCREREFRTFADLDRELARLLGAEEFDAVVHAAAVGDFGIESVQVGEREFPPGAGKLESGAAPVLRLRPQPKLVEGLRGRSRSPRLKVVAFKLTSGASDEAARAAVADLFARSGADWVVHNDTALRAGPDAFPAEIYASGAPSPTRCATRGELAEGLERLLTLAEFSSCYP
jgi:phosphopantothenoylcysteine decarboxylase/phosphopantothenate--cysteine ligase